MSTYHRQRARTHTIIRSLAHELTDCARGGSGTAANSTTMTGKVSVISGVLMRTRSWRQTPRRHGVLSPCSQTTAPDLRCCVALVSHHPGPRPYTHPTACAFLRYSPAKRVWARVSYERRQGENRYKKRSLVGAVRSPEQMRGSTCATHDNDNGRRDRHANQEVAGRADDCE